MSAAEMKVRSLLASQAANASAELDIRARMDARDAGEQKWRADCREYDAVHEAAKKKRDAETRTFEDAHKSVMEKQVLARRGHEADRDQLRGELRDNYARARALRVDVDAARAARDAQELQKLQYGD